jgi:hypothetical protein
MPRVGDRVEKNFGYYSDLGVVTEADDPWHPVVLFDHGGEWIVDADCLSLLD